MKNLADYISRRNFLRTAPAGGAALVLGNAAPPWLTAQEPQKQEQEEDVTPAEDLMREHGVLKRVLLIYDEVIRRVHAKKDFPPEAVSSAAVIIQTFIENYHEKLEEEHLFPRFRTARRLIELVEVLEAQHRAGRTVTEQILTLTTQRLLKARADQERLAQALHRFVRMYAPHEAREDTVLFPELAKIMSHSEYDALGDEFENIEHQKFGQDGFESMVEKVAVIEKQLGIYDLAQFTPQ
jgi:hemerythrin-like domain-containing protein